MPDQWRWTHSQQKNVADFPDIHGRLSVGTSDDGTVVAILNTTLVFTPIPLSNVVPALVIALISLAYLEEDGLLLSIALLASGIVLAVEFAAVWETILGD